MMNQNGVEQVEEFSTENVVDDNDQSIDKSQEKMNESTIKEINKSPKEDLDEKDQFARILTLEDELRHALKKLDEVTLQKATLEKIVKSKDAELNKTAIDLEQCLQKVTKLRELAKRNELEIQTLKKQNDALVQINLVSNLSKRSEIDRQRVNKQTLPEDSLDRIIALENHIKIKEFEAENLRNEIKVVTSALEKKDKAIEELDKKLRSIQWKEDRAYETECKNSELNLHIEKLNKEIKTLQHINRVKTQTIESLNNQLEKHKNLEEDYQALKKEEIRLNKEKENILLELKMAKKAIDEKDKEIFKIINSKDDVAIRNLENDKRVLTNEIQKLVAKNQQLEKTINSQKRKIASLTLRLEALNAALNDTRIIKLLDPKKLTPRKAEIEDIECQDDKAEETITVAQFNLLQASAEVLRKRVAEQEVIIEDKEAIIEMLQRNVNILEKAKASEAKAAKRKIEDLTNELEIERKNLTNKSREFKSRENQLKEEKFKMKAKLRNAKMSKK